MRPVEGKYYCTAAGRKVGPLRRVPDGYSGGDWALWETDDATYELIGVPREHALETDIVAEWDDVPIDVREDDSEYFEELGFPSVELNVTGLYTEPCANYGMGRKEETPQRWGDMTSEEKGALLLAHHEGKVIEVRAENCDLWYIRENPNWSENGIFRIRHEPVVEVESVWWNGHDFWECRENGETHVITFSVVDGEPDCASIRMEKL